MPVVSPPNPMPNTRAKLERLIDALLRADRSDRQELALLFAQRFLKGLENSILMSFHRDSLFGQLVLSVNGFPFYTSRDDSILICNNAMYRDAVEALVIEFGGEHHHDQIQG